jgi:multiple sugar transport system substrate-binding protein
VGSVASLEVNVDRRLLLSLGAGVGLAGLAGCGDGSASGSAGSTGIGMAWWGSTARHKRTQDALAAFTRRHPGVKVSTQFSSWDGYWEKLGAEVASGSAPDVIQMDYSYITQYARHGYLRALDTYVPKVINLSTFNASVLAGGLVDNKLYGVNNGINCAALLVNVTLLRQFGLDLPDHQMTWTDFAELTKQIGRKAPAAVYGTEDAARNSAALECWLRQRGKALFTVDGKALGFTTADLAEWLTYWQDLRKARAAPPAALQATALGDVQNHLVARRKAVFDFTNSNQLNAYASMLKDQLALHMLPQGPAGAKPGQYLKPSQLFSMSAKTEHAQEAASLINALVTDPEVTAILGSERGIPPSTTVRATLKAKAGPVERQTYEFVDFIAGRTGPLPPPAPANGSTVTEKILTTTTQQVAFGRATIGKAVPAFFEAASRALKQ